MEIDHNTKGIVLTLDQLKVKETAKVIKIQSDDLNKIRKLVAFGIMNGMEVNIIQKYPAIVLQVGFTQVAIDDDIASQIIVEKI